MGKAETDTKYQIYFAYQICKNHPQEAELRAATLLYTHPEGRTAEYKTPVERAGSEEGKTLLSATVVDQRARGAGKEDTVQVTMRPGESAGEVMTRAQKALDNANGIWWKPWKLPGSGLICTRQADTGEGKGEVLSPEEVMPTEEVTLHLRGTKTARRRAQNKSCSTDQPPTKTGPQALAKPQSQALEKAENTQGLKTARQKVEERLAAQRTQEEERAKETAMATHTTKAPPQQRPETEEQKQKRRDEATLQKENERLRKERDRARRIVKTLEKLAKKEMK